MMQQTKRLTGWVLGGAMALSSAGPLVASAAAQDRHHDDRFRNGYYRQRPYDDRYDRDRYRHDNGIGPGKGALIGGAAGAALGAVFGGGLKGALIGGGVGAGGGALIGKAAQDNRRDHDYRDRYDRYGRPY